MTQIYIAYPDGVVMRWASSLCIADLIYWFDPLAELGLYDDLTPL